MRGSTCGVTSNVTTQFTRATASWLAATIDRTAIRPSVQTSTGLPWALATRSPARVSVIRTIPPTYSSDGRPAAGSPQPLPGGKARRHGTLQLSHALADQVETNVRRAVVAALGGRAFLRQVNRLSCHVAFEAPAVFGDLLHHVAIAVASGEFHPAVDSAGVLPQRLLHHAHGLDEFAPIERAQVAQAADAVAHRHLVGGLFLVFRLHHLLNRPAGFGETLLDPGERQGQRWTLPLQAARQFGHERALHRRVRASHVGDGHNQVLRILLGGLDQLVRPGVGADSGRCARRRRAPPRGEGSRSAPGAA